MSFASARKKAGYTQAEVGERLKVHQSAVAQWENGLTSPTASKLVELAKLYHCTVDELLKRGETDA
jgi:transcriptional regulator with XRE-family HTH domain